VNETRQVRMEPIPTGQQVENNHRKGQTGAEIIPNPVHHFLEMANGGQHRKDGFDNHVLIMVERLAHLQISRVPFFGMESMIREDRGAIYETLIQRMRVAIMHVGGVTVPVDHLGEMVEQERQLAAYDPAPIGIAFLTNLLLQVSFAHRVDQLDPIAVDDTQQTGFDQKAVGPGLMGNQQAKQPGSFWQVGKEEQVILCQQR
jgi:hypothetical protein